MYIFLDHSLNTRDTIDLYTESTIHLGKEWKTSVNLA